MNSVLRPLVLSSLFIWAGTSTQAADLTPFSVPASDSAAVRRIYGIGAFANPASKASVSVEAGILRAEFDLASDSTEGYSANVGLNIPLSSEGGPVRLAIRQGVPLFKRVRFEYRLSEKVTDVLNWVIESDAYPPAYEVHHFADLAGSVALEGSTSWKTASLEYLDFVGPIMIDFESPSDFVLLDSALMQATGFQVRPRSLYTTSGSHRGNACNKCVNPTMKHVVMEMRRIEIDQIGPEADSAVLVLGLPKAQVGVAHRMAAPAGDVFWQGGILRISRPSRWTSLSVLAPDGRHLRTLTSSAEQPLDLPPGTYRVVLRDREGAQAVRNLIRLR